MNNDSKFSNPWSQCQQAVLEETEAAAGRHLTLVDYINGYMANVMDYLRERNGVESLNVLGYCMGGTMSAMFTALHPNRVSNLMLMAAPIDFATRDGLLNIWTRAEN